MSRLVVFISAICLASVYCEEDKPKDAYTNDPVELMPVYHKPNQYEERSYDFWYDNWPQPHVHGDKPKYDERHQHYKGYGEDNYDFSNFITDPPTVHGSKLEEVVESGEEAATEAVPEEPKKKDYGPVEETPVVQEKVTKPAEPVQVPSSSLTKEGGTPPRGDSNSRSETNSQSTGYTDTPPDTDTHIAGTFEEPQPPVPPPGRGYPEGPSPSKGDYSVSGGSSSQNNGNAPPTDEYFKSPPGTQPELFAEAKPSAGNSYNGNDDPYAPAPDPAPKQTGKTDFFPDSELGGGPVTLSPRPIDGDEGYSGGPRSCCPCCQAPVPVLQDNGGGGCGQPVCGPPPIVGTPQNCCPVQPAPCCPKLPNCCIPQLPCCPRIQIPCCPPIQVCCQPTGCNRGCRSRALTRVRTKRLGCIPCIGRKKRDVFEEIVHIRQKRLGCIPCLLREKRQAALPQPAGCQKCNPFQQHLVRRVKRTFSCSSCRTHHERKKRQSQIADFFRGNQLGAYRNCEQCFQDIAPNQPRIMKRSVFDAQNEFVSRVKRGSDGYDPLFKCDSGCCDYNKCIKSKPLRGGTFKVPTDDDFISGTASSDYDLTNAKDLDLSLKDIDGLEANAEPKHSRTSR